jgi:hypothetical protein
MYQACSYIYKNAFNAGDISGIYILSGATTSDIRFVVQHGAGGRRRAVLPRH